MDHEKTERPARCVGVLFHLSDRVVSGTADCELLDIVMDVALALGLGSDGGRVSGTSLNSTRLYELTVFKEGNSS